MNLPKWKDIRTTLKNQLFLYIINEQSKKEIKGIIPFVIASKRTKHLGISLIKETEHLCAENYKTWLTEIKT